MLEFKSKKPDLMINSLTNEGIASFKIEPYVVKELEKLSDDKDYSIKISVASRKRTHTQNSYMWVLLGEISKKISLPVKEVYRDYIRDYGVYKALPIKNEAVNDFVEKWEKGGIGWLCEVSRDSKINGYSLVLAYFGSSTYTVEEMKNLIEPIVFDCNEMGINTEPLSKIFEWEV